MKLLNTLSVVALLGLTRLISANETTYAALTRNEANYEFADGAKVEIITSGRIDRRYGLGLLMVEKFEIRLRQRKIETRKLQEFLGKLAGIKIETIQVSCDAVELPSGKFELEYMLTFEFLAQAFGPLSPQPSEHRMIARVKFDDIRITEVKLAEK
jgi:hypothetical protein